MGVYGLCRLMSWLAGIEALTTKKPTDDMTNPDIAVTMHADLHTTSCAWYA